MVPQYVAPVTIQKYQAALVSMGPTSCPERVHVEVSISEVATSRLKGSDAFMNYAFHGKETC